MIIGDKKGDKGTEMGHKTAKLNDMGKDNRIGILKKCFDTLADFPYLTATPDKEGLFKSIIDTLAEYPKPKEKHGVTEPDGKTMGAYLFVSNARNIIKLGCIGFYNFKQSAKLAGEYLECAFSLLVDIQAEK